MMISSTDDKFTRGFRGAEAVATILLGTNRKIAWLPRREQVIAPIPLEGNVRACEMRRLVRGGEQWRTHMLSATTWAMIARRRAESEPSLDSRPASTRIKSASSSGTPSAESR